MLLVGCAGPLKGSAKQEEPLFKPVGGVVLSEEEYTNYTSNQENLLLVNSYKEVVGEKTYYYELLAIKDTKTTVSIETKTTFTYFKDKEDLHISITYFENRATSCEFSMVSQENRQINQLVSTAAINYNPIDDFAIKHNSYSCTENNLVTYTIDNSYNSGLYQACYIDTRYDMILVQKDIENGGMISARLFSNKSVITHEWDFVFVKSVDEHLYR